MHQLVQVAGHGSSEFLSSAQRGRGIGSLLLCWGLQSDDVAMRFHDGGLKMDLRVAAPADVAYGRTSAVVVVASLTALFLVSVLASRPWRPRGGGLRRVAQTFSIMSLVGVGCLGYLAATRVDRTPEIGEPLRSGADVDAYFANHPAAASSGAAFSEIRIPTGVFLQSIKFGGANDVDVSGYVWQKYADTVPTEIKRGFVLPEADAGASSVSEAYRFTVDHVEVIGWYVNTTLRETFDYRRYPFDRQDVWLRLWHPDLDRRVVLVPDFASFPDVSPASRPGLESQFVRQGWHPAYTAFSYASNAYNTSFGYGRQPAPEGYPELYFSVGLKRDFVRPLLENIIPLIVVLALLFFALRLSGQDATEWERGPFEPLDTLGYCVGLLFVVLLEHTHIRGAIPPEQIAYLESLVFIS
jgi:hypothetical protein